MAIAESEVIYESDSVEETEKLGAKLAPTAAEFGFVALYGGLGAGKTAFVRGLASVIANGAQVSSPTYAIVNEYAPADSLVPTLFHFDMYRITDEDGLASIDFDGYFERHGVIVTEWSENITFALPERYLKVEILPEGDKSRKIVVSECRG